MSNNPNATKVKAEYLEDFSEIHDNTVEKWKELLTQLMEGSPTITPEEVADIIFKAIKDEKLYILLILSHLLKIRWKRDLMLF